MHQGIDMKSFKEHLAESKKTYTFRAKVAGDFSKDQENAMESLLSKWQIGSFKKTGTTPVQDVPLDFPKIKNAEVSIYEFTLAYPTTQFELSEYLSNELKITKDRFVVRSPNEPTEDYQQVIERREGALLNNDTYEETVKVNSEDFYGDKYNSGFVKELNDILKLQRKERGEVIPEASDKEIGHTAKAKFNTDAPQNNTSPIKQADRTPLRK
jgi:hypothetical protein